MKSLGKQFFSGTSALVWEILIYAVFSLIFIYFFRGPGLTLIKRVTGERRDVCEVAIPNDVLIYDQVCESNRDCRGNTNDAEVVWVMDNINYPEENFEVAVLESGSALLRNGGIVYAKAGSIVGDHGGSGAGGKTIFHEKGAKIYDSSRMTLIQCGEIVTSQAKPANIVTPNERIVDVLFYEDRPRSEELNSVIRFEPDIAYVDRLAFGKNSSQLCLDRVHWAARGIPRGLLSTIENTFKTSVVVRYGDIYMQKKEFWMQDIDDLYSTGFRDDYAGVARGTEVLFNRTLRPLCFTDLPGPGTYEVEIELDTTNRLKETNEDNNVFRSTFELK